MSDWERHPDKHDGDCYDRGLSIYKDLEDAKTILAQWQNYSKKGIAEVRLKERHGVVQLQLEHPTEPPHLVDTGWGRPARSMRWSSVPSVIDLKELEGAAPDPKALEDYRVEKVLVRADFPLLLHATTSAPKEPSTRRGKAAKSEERSKADWVVTWCER